MSNDLMDRADGTVRITPTFNCGCDAHGAADLISIDVALTRIKRTICAIGDAQVIPLAQAAGRTLTVAVRALDMVPPFANSAMDGYAINTADLIGDGPWTLHVADRVAAGQAPQNALRHGTAAQIFTGAPVPDRANAVIMQEDVTRTEAGIEIRRKVAPGTHIRAAGEDMVKGKIVVPADRLLTPRDIAAVAAAGHGTVTVLRKLRVALVVTGDEVCQPGQARGAAGIWDVNTPMIAATMTQPALDLCHIETAADTRRALSKQLARLAAKVDLIVTTGGISVGQEDHVKPALDDLGAQIVFSGVAIKPGKPVSLGKLGRTVWLGLPGNPLSAFVTWQVFGVPLCRALGGQAADPCASRKVALSKPISHKHGRCEMRCAQLTGIDDLGRAIAAPAAATHSGRVATLPDMDGLIRIPADAPELPVGAIVDFTPF